MSEHSEVTPDERSAWERWQEAKRNVEIYLHNNPSYPGAHFNHEIETKGPGAPLLYTIPDIQLTNAEILCPCQQRIILQRDWKKNGEVDIITCGTCFNWHAITWRVSQPPKKGGHFLAAKRKS